MGQIKSLNPLIADFFNNIGQLVTEFIRQLVAAGEIMESAVARPKWNQASPDALSRHAKQNRRQGIRVESLKHLRQIRADQ
jgi:hypothetical protein